MLERQLQVMSAVFQVRIMIDRVGVVIENYLNRENLKISQGRKTIEGGYF